MDLKYVCQQYFICNNSGGKTRMASEGVDYDIYFTEYDFCPV
jgi:hypothetical protein